MKALAQDQRYSLVSTGLLRLLNTAIQAFPSILIASFLRSIETGTNLDVAKSLKAAVLLVLLLVSKMIIENQYFHKVVNMSTEVRGSLEGMIFDKALRLPEGGSGVLINDAKQNINKTLGIGGVSKNNRTNDNLSVLFFCYQFI